MKGLTQGGVGGLAVNTEKLMEQVRLSEEAESAGGALLQADSSETQGGGCIRSEVLRHRAAAR